MSTALCQRLSFISSSSTTSFVSLAQIPNISLWVNLCRQLRVPPYQMNRGIKLILRLKPVRLPNIVRSDGLPSSHRGGTNTFRMIFIDQSYLLSPILLLYGLGTPVRINCKSYAWLMTKRWSHLVVTPSIWSDDIANNAIHPISVAAQHERKVQWSERGRILGARFSRGRYIHVPATLGRLAQLVSR